MAIKKIIYGDMTLLDLTSDTVTADSLLLGHTAHDADGNQITGANTYDADTSDATATASEILSGKTAYVAGSKVTGSMPDNGSISGTISIVDGTYTIPAGYHDGTGTVSIDSAEQAKIIASNIKDGVTVLGVQGAYKGLTLTPVTPNGTNITNYYMPKTSAKPVITITWEDKTNTRSDEYVVEAGKSYLARYVAPYGAWCQTAFSLSSLIGNTSSVYECIKLAPDKFHGNIFFTASMNGYLIMYKDDTSSDEFSTECFEITYNY